jgi:hypothetical protein
MEFIVTPNVGVNSISMWMPRFDNVPDFVIEAQTNKQLGGYIIENGGDINGDGI